MTTPTPEQYVAFVQREGQPMRGYAIEIHPTDTGNVWVVPTEIRETDKVAIQPDIPADGLRQIQDVTGRLLHFPYNNGEEVNLLDESVLEQPAPETGVAALRKYLDGEIADPNVLWWVTEAFEEARATVKKAREYGSAELVYAGHVIASIGDRQVNDAEAMELQIFHYCLGKMGRWTAAVRRGEPVSDDTIFDLGVYVRMVQRIRQTGEWP